MAGRERGRVRPLLTAAVGVAVLAVLCTVLFQAAAVQLPAPATTATPGGTAAAQQRGIPPADTAAVLAHAARPVPCGEGCKGVVVAAVADAAFASALHSWLLFADRAVPGGVGAPSAGVVVAAADTELLWWCASRRVPCVHFEQCPRLRRQLTEAASAGSAALTRGRAATIAPQWCKVFALDGILGAGYAGLVVDADVALLSDPVPRARQLLTANRGALHYQCGERDLRTDTRLLGGFHHWPNTGHLLVAPGGGGAELISVVAAEGVWQGERAVELVTGGWRRPQRPRLPCREELLSGQITMGLKALHAKGRWTMRDANALCMLGYGRKCADQKEAMRIQRLGDPVRGRLRDMRSRVAGELVSLRRAGALNATSLRSVLAAFCASLPRNFCGMSGRELERLLPGYPQPDEMTDAAAVGWVQGHCADPGWGEQETLREALEHTTGGMLRRTDGPVHMCLPEDEFPMAYDHTGELWQSARRRRGNPVTVHVAGADPRRGGLRFRGGADRFALAVKHGLLEPPRCRSSFSADARDHASDPPPKVDLSDAWTSVCRQ